MEKNTLIIIVIFLVMFIIFSQAPKETAIGIKVHFIKDGVEVYPQKGLFTIVTPPGIDVDYVYFEIFGVNDAEVPISDIHIVEGWTSEFESSLSEVTPQSLGIGEDKLLWTSEQVDATLLEEYPQPIKFWIDVVGIYSGEPVSSERAYSEEIYFGIVPEVCPVGINNGDGTCTIILQTPNTENLEDVHVSEIDPDYNFGKNPFFAVGEQSKRNKEFVVYTKFNISLPPEIIIQEASLSYFVYQNYYEELEIITTQVYEVSNQGWVEGSFNFGDCPVPSTCDYGITWNRKPAIGNLIDTNTDFDGLSDDFWLDFDVTSWVTSSRIAGNENISFYWNSTLEYGVGDSMLAYSKDYTGSSLRPKLTITYTL